MKIVSDHDVVLARGLFLCVGAACFFTAFSSYRSDQARLAENEALIAQADSTEGIVIKMMPRETSPIGRPGTSISYFPIVQYEDDSGSTLTFESSTAGPFIY